MKTSVIPSALCQQCVIICLQVLPTGECHPGGAKCHHSHPVQPHVWEDGGGESGEHQQGTVQYPGMCGYGGGRAGLHTLFHQRWVDVHAHVSKAGHSLWVSLHTAKKGPRDVEGGACRSRVLLLNWCNPLLVLTFRLELIATVNWYKRGRTDMKISLFLIANLHPADANFIKT